MGTVISSGTVYVNSGDKLNSPDILNTGKVYVNSGGSATNATIHDGGEEYVLSNGWDYDAQISSGGGLHVNTGRSYRAQVFNGGVVSGIGASIHSAVVNNGGSMALSGYVHQISGLVTRGYVKDTTINSGGVVTLEKFAACSDTTINGGKLFVSSGASATGVTLNGGYILVDSGYVDSLIMSGGSMLIRGESVLNPGVVKHLTLGFGSGVVWVEEGGLISNGSIRNDLNVQKNGRIEDVVVWENGGYLVVDNGGTQHGGIVHGSEAIASGGMASDVKFHGDIDLRGTAKDCTLIGGSVTISDGGSFTGNAEILSDDIGRFWVNSGGTATVNKVSGPRLLTYLNGGVMDVSAGGLDFVQILETGGTFNLGAEASVGTASLFGGVMNVKGVLRHVRVSSGASVMISSGGIVTGRYNILNGAVVSAAAGATVDFDLHQTSAGAAALLSNLSLISGTPNYSLTVDANQAIGSYKLAGGAAGFNKTITVKDSAGTELGTIKVDGNPVGYSGKMFGLKLTDGTLSVLVVNGSSENVFMGTVTSGTKTITSGSSAVGATVDVEGLLIIEDGGNASNTLVKAGGEMVVSSGGKVKGITIEEGGMASVLEDVMAENVVVNGGMFSLEQYGWAYHLSNGHTVSSNTVVKNGGQVIVHESAYLVGAYVSEGGRVDVMSDGTFETGRINDGEVYAFNGALVSRVDLEDGGILNVESGGIVRHINVSAGGVLTGVLREASELTFYGGTLDLDISTAAPGSEFLVDEQSYTNIDMHISDKIYYLCTLSVGDSQPVGTYSLIEGASGFNKTVTVMNTSKEALGTLTVGQTTNIGNFDYTLNQDTYDNLTVTIAAAAPTPGSYIAKSDINGNGVSDVMFQLVKGDYGFGQIGFWLDGTNTWQSEMAVHPTDSWKVLGAYDMDANGNADTVLVGNIVMDVGGTDLPMYAIGYYTDSVDLDANWQNISYLGNPDHNVWNNAVGNLTGNQGMNSIVWHSTDLGVLGAWTDGTDNWVSLGIGYKSDWKMAGCGDFDGDGKDSVLMVFQGAAYYAVDIVGAEGVANPLTSSDANWTVSAIGDFSGDGKDDIIAYNASASLVAMWGDGDATNKWSLLGMLDKNDWFIVGAGDYNGDEKDDLLVRQNSTGMLGYYTSGDMEQWVELGRGVDMNWSVIA